MSEGGQSAKGASAIEKFVNAAVGAALTRAKQELMAAMEGQRREFDAAIASAKQELDAISALRTEMQQFSDHQGEILGELEGIYALGKKAGDAPADFDFTEVEALPASNEVQLLREEVARLREIVESATPSVAASEGGWDPRLKAQLDQWAREMRLEGMEQRVLERAIAAATAHVGGAVANAVEISDRATLDAEGAAKIDDGDQSTSGGGFLSNFARR